MGVTRYIHNNPPLLDAPNCVGICMCRQWEKAMGGLVITNGFHGTRLPIYVVCNI